MKKNNSKNAYDLYNYQEIRFGDPISAMTLNNQYLLIGTMLGRIIIYSLQARQAMMLCDQSNENISSISLDQFNVLHICIGDESILQYDFNKENTLSSETNCSTIRNYTNDSDHIKNCDNCYTVLYEESFFCLIMDQPEEGNVVISRSSFKYEIKNLQTYKIEEGEIDMTNYSVPFDYDGKRFIWVEFLSDCQRNIGVHFFQSKSSSSWRYSLDKDFGHISQCKLISNTNQLFLVRKLVHCEIRAHDDHFTVIKQLLNIGDEVIASQIVFGISKGDNNSEESKDQNIIYINNQFNNNNKVSDNPKETNRNNNMKIILLDIDGNINCWKGNRITTLINMYDMERIPKEHKKKQLFSLGYMYYIIKIKGFIAVASDHGCYLLKKNKEEKLYSNAKIKAHADK